MRRTLVLILAAAVATAGCIGTVSSPSEDEEDTEEIDQASVEEPQRGKLVDLDTSVEPSLSFTERNVDAAVGYARDLYEPTMEVSDTGVIYVTGHTMGAAVTGAPVFMSQDDGESWEQLPFFADAQMPAGLHGATPPPSAEIFLAAGEDGQLWGADVSLATFPVNGWCDDGAEHCYHNPDAADEAQEMTTRAQAASGTDGSCSQFNFNDRPWVAYGDGRILLVNNPGGGPVQVGLMDVPTMRLGGPGLGASEPVSAQWNLCAGEGGGNIPGIPDMREDHFFAVPQVQDQNLVVVQGQGSVDDVEQRTVFNLTNNEAAPGHTTNYGQVVFDDEGTMFVGARNNTKGGADGEGTGRIKLAVSTDDGESFATRTFETGPLTGSLYLDGNMHGPGALLTWAQVGDDGFDWYAAHLSVGDDGRPVVENVSLALEDGPPPSVHVQGAAAGPDGRAYLVMHEGDYLMHEGGYLPADQATPLDVIVQQGGPTLPASDTAE